MLRTSSRIPSSLESNAITTAFQLKKSRREKIIDLTESNPTQVGFRYPEREISSIFGKAETFLYEPEPRGLLSTRSFIAKNCSPLIGPENVWMTSSSSESYSFLFKLLCDPGDEVLVPTPSYPLFEGLLNMDGVRPRFYSLEHGKGWWLNRSHIEREVSQKTRAILIVNPNNPTGNFVSENDQEWLLDFCRIKNIPLIVDEVFFQFPVQGKGRSFSEFLKEDVSLFVLGGFSKQFALPQVKLSWILSNIDASGAEQLDWISDHYLTVPSLQQHACKKLWGALSSVLPQVRERVNRNYSLLCREMESSQVKVLACEGGWNAVLSLPSSVNEEETVLGLLENRGVLVYPGFYFDLPFQSSLVISLLLEEADFRSGIQALRDSL